jgi:phosphinothricin acetyltransferase
MITCALLPKHWPAVRTIYEEGIATGDATFETSAPAWEVWDASHLPFARVVAQENGEVLGWGALSRVSDRCAYSGVAEVSVYVTASARARGVGSVLLAALIEESEANGIWTLTAGIFPENVASIRLHEKAGFRVLGVRERVGKLKGRWRDALLLERRSRVVGIEGEKR